MTRYVLRRLLHGIPIVLGVSVITFVLFYVFGGDPVLQYLGKHATPEQIAALQRQYGLDRPLYIQYLAYLREIVTLDFGLSFESHEPVSQLLWRGVGPSLSLTVPALFATTILSVSVGLVAARFRGRAVDRGLMVLAVAGMSVSFLVYIVVGQYLLAFEWPLFHIHGYRPGVVERWPYLALPILILVVVGMGYDTRFYRSAIVEEVDKEHITTAYAKGLGTPRVLFVHVLKNAMVPIVTRVMISVPFLVTGSLLLESFFGIPGLGGTLLHALDTADFPVIKAYTILVSVLFVVTNVLTDVFYAWLDPRIRLS